MLLMLSIEENYRLITLLTGQVSAKAGLDTIQASDCRWLAADISRYTGQNLSETTVKRFYGFAATNFQASLTTRNIFCRYLDFSGWEKFINSSLLTIPDTEPEAPSIWLKMQAKAARFSGYTFKALKNRSGIPFEATIDRQFAETQILYFLESNYPVTSFIAPGGFGKSILLSRLVDKFWLSDKALFKNDIAWFVSGQTLGGLLSQGFDFETWIAQQAGLNDNQSFQNYFTAHQPEVSGRMILILDGFDEIIHKDDLLYSFFDSLCEFINRNRRHKWFKVIFSVRTSTWSALFSDMKRSTFIQHYWYLGTGFTNLSNVHPLLPSEVDRILTSLYPDAPRLKGDKLATELILQLANPYYIQLLYQLQRLQTDREINLAGFSYYDLVSEFINRKIYQSRYCTEKISIIRQFLDKIRGGENLNFIVKDTLLRTESANHTAYNELISYGVLVEDVLVRGHELLKIVFFNHINLLEYFLCSELLDIHNQHVDDSLFSHINQSFRNSRYQLQLYKWVIYYAVSSRQHFNTAVIQQLDISSREKKELVIFFAETIRQKYVVAGVQPDDDLLQEISQHAFYFSGMLSFEFTGGSFDEALETFLLFTINKNESIYLRSCLALRCFNNLDSRGMLRQIENIELSETYDTDYAINPMIFLRLIYTLSTSDIPEQAAIQEGIKLIGNSGLTIRQHVNPYEKLLHSLILCFLQVTNIAEVSFTVLDMVNENSRRTLLSVRNNAIYLAYFIHYVHNCLRKRQPASFRLITLVKLFLDSYPSIHLTAFSKIGYEVLLSQWSLLDNEVELAEIFLTRIQQLCTIVEHNFYRLIADRNLLSYYQQHNMLLPTERMLYQLRGRISAGDFNLERLLGYGNTNS